MTEENESIFICAARSKSMGKRIAVTGGGRLLTRAEFVKDMTHEIWLVMPDFDDGAQRKAADAVWNKLVGKEKSNVKEKEEGAPASP